MVVVLTKNQDTEQAEAPLKDPKKDERAKEVGGPKGLEPTRYGDWERKGIASDF